MARLFLLLASALALAAAADPKKKSDDIEDSLSLARRGKGPAYKPFANGGYKKKPAPIPAGSGEEYPPVYKPGLGAKSRAIDVDSKHARGKNSIPEQKGLKDPKFYHVGPKPWTQRWKTHGPVANAPDGCHCSHANCQNKIPNGLSLEAKAKKWNTLCQKANKLCCGCSVCVTDKYTSMTPLQDFFEGGPCDTNNLPPDDNWQLAMNINTGDGNVVPYCNTDFWESTSALGGADDVDTLKDYKNLEAMQVPAEKVLIIVHEEGTAIGWRAWQSEGTTKSLQQYFTTANTAMSGFPAGNFFGSTYGGNVCSLVENEPMVRNSINGTSADKLFFNIFVGDLDKNRVSTIHAGGQNQNYNNYGWGLGTSYDHNIGACNTHRPTNDAQMHTTVHHWGSGGGMGGMIGSDNICNGGCPWTRSSGYNYDYSIFVAE
jgi:hypothetical protein